MTTVSNVPIWHFGVGNKLLHVGTVAAVSLPAGSLAVITFGCRDYMSVSFIMSSSPLSIRLAYE